MPDAHHSRDARPSKQVTMQPRPYYAKMQSPDNRGGVVAGLNLAYLYNRVEEKGKQNGKRERLVDSGDKEGGDSGGFLKEARERMSRSKRRRTMTGEEKK